MSYIATSDQSVCLWANIGLFREHWFRIALRERALFLFRWILYRRETLSALCLPVERIGLIMPLAR